MRILFVTRTLNRGGAERQLLTLAEALSQRGFHVVVATFYPSTALLEDADGPSFRVVSLAKTSRWDFFGFLRRFRALIREERPDIVYSFHTTPNIFAALAAQGGETPKVVWGVRSTDLNLSAYGWQTRAAAHIEQRLSTKAHLIISNSQAGRSHAIQRGFPEMRVVVVANGIDTERFQFDAGAREAFRKAMGFQASDVVVGLVARDDPAKGVDLFAAAVAILSEALPNCRFLWIGASHVDHERVGPGVRVIPSQDDMPRVYSGLDVVCSASTSEGFSNAIAEAMACGRPCVVTDVGDSSAIVGETGVVVPPGNADALAEGIRTQVARLPANERTRTRIEQNFSIARMVEATLQHLTPLIADTSDSGS